MPICFVKLSKTENFTRHVSVVVYTCADSALMKSLAREEGNSLGHKGLFFIQLERPKLRESGGPAKPDCAVVQA